MLYAIFIFATFLVLKIVNFRLHKSLDTNPEEEEEEEQQPSSEGEQDVGDDGEKGDREKGEEGERERKELNLDGQVVETAQTKAEEAGVMLPGQVGSREEEEESKKNDVEDSLQRHRDSASTLGHSSTYHSGVDDTAELQPVTTAHDHSGGEGGGEGVVGGGGEGGEEASSLLVMIDTEVEGRRSREGGEGVSDQTDSSTSRGRDTSGEVVYSAPSLAVSSSTEPGLKPINEEPQSSSQTSDQK